MQRLRQVQQIWNWLPAFRAVAETEHLPTAAERLHVSASALSRTVRLLEDDMGVELFHRVGRRIVLNDAGRALLDRTRSAMRLVHEALDDALDTRVRGVVRVSAAGLATEPFVVPALVDLRRTHPDLEVVVTAVSPPAVVAMLVRGDLDVAIQSVQVHDARTTLYHLGEESNGVYCGPSHPLAGREEVTLDELRSHPFAAPPADAMGRTPEGWPSDIKREVRWSISQMAVGLQVCSLGEALAVLPDVVARSRPELWRLPIDVVPPTPVVAVTRKNLGTRGKAELVVEGVTAQVASARHSLSK